MKEAMLTLTEFYAIGPNKITKYQGITDGVFFTGDNKEGELFKVKTEELTQEELSGTIMIDSYLDEMCRCESSPVSHEDVCEYFRIFHTDRPHPSDDLMAHNFR